MKTILFTGVHGVGKGFYLEKNCRDTSRVQVLSASGLIQEYKSAADAGYKKVLDVYANQDVLLKALQQQQVKAKFDIILDGHLCILNAKGGIEKIPEYFFVQGNFEGIILLQDDVRLIAERINSRDGEKINILLLDEIQKLEREYAVHLKETIGLEYEIINPECNGQEFIRIIEKLGGKTNG